MSKAKLVEEPQGIDWSKIKDEEDVIDIIGLDNIYDSTPDDFDDIYEVLIREDIISRYMMVHSIEKQLWEENGEEPTSSQIGDELNLDYEEIEQIVDIYEDASFWKPYTRGIILIYGEEGAGKDLLAHSLACRFRNYYGKTPIIDSKPKPEFGYCIPFSREFLVDQIKRINHFVSANSNALSQSTTNKEWIDPDMGKIFLKNSVLLFSEFSNVMHRMKQSSPISRLMASIAKQWRHLEYCMIACDADERSIDPNYFLPRVTCRIHATQHYEKNNFVYKFQPVKYNTGSQALNISGKIENFRLVGNEPHFGLDGHCPYDIYHTKNAQGIDIPKSLLKG